MSIPKIALVYDRVNKIGGAERILTALHEIWPSAPLYTSVYDEKGAPWAKDFDIKTSFLQHIPFFRNHHEYIPFLMPIAFESFKFDQYDIVVSITSAEAKGIITKPQTLHICYCLTPTRYLWNGEQIYLESINQGFFKKIKTGLAKYALNYLKKWDQIACHRPDYYLSISNEVKQRIKKYYQKDSEIIYPPVDTNKFVLRVNPSKGINPIEKPYYLLVSRLVPYKKIDLAIRAFNNLPHKLIIIGRGSEEKYLKSISKDNIQFITDNLTDTELIGYYQNCVALIFPGVEDFGLTPLEAMACGKPVIAYREGGVLESVIEGVTGEFFSPQTPKALEEVIKEFNSDKYLAENCRKQAEKFSKQIFQENFLNIVEKLYKRRII